MSNNDSLDEETKRLLAEVEADAQSGSNDSKESKPQKNKDEHTDYEIYDDIKEQDAKVDDSDW